MADRPTTWYPTVDTDPDGVCLNCGLDYCEDCEAPGQCTCECNREDPFTNEGQSAA